MAGLAFQIFAFPKNEALRELFETPPLVGNLENLPPTYWGDKRFLKKNNVNDIYEEKMKILISLDPVWKRNEAQ